jgi:hypothetical protein
VLRRIFFLAGLAGVSYGGWLLHREHGVSTLCNSRVFNPKSGVFVPVRCYNEVWPYSIAFGALILGLLCFLAALLITRRVMSGERQYLRDMRAGKFDRENDHLHALNLTVTTPRHPVEGRLVARPQDAPSD